jgi:hypothetical protein
MPQNKTLQAVCNTIKRFCGIELNWAENKALSNYLKCFSQEMDQDTTNNRNVSEATFRFLDDYFDLDVRELAVHYYTDPLDKKLRKYGSSFAGTPEFILYCRDYVQMWRNEREMW